jgi:hypothetical protein
VGKTDKKRGVFITEFFLQNAAGNDIIIQRICSTPEMSFNNDNSGG